MRLETSYLLQGQLIIGRHILVAINGNNVAVLLVSEALLLITLVLVILLSVNATVLDDKGKGKVHEATMAAMVLGAIAVHQLLLTQGHQLLGFNSVDAFNGACGGKSPAGATLQQPPFPVSVGLEEPGSTDKLLPQPHC